MEVAELGVTVTVHRKINLICIIILYTPKLHCNATLLCSSYYIHMHQFGYAQAALLCAAHTYVHRYIQCSGTCMHIRTPGAHAVHQRGWFCTHTKSAIKHYTCGLEEVSPVLL